MFVLLSWLEGRLLDGPVRRVEFSLQVHCYQVTTTAVTEDGVVAKPVVTKRALLHWAGSLSLEML
jgi:hypothetical protein